MLALPAHFARRPPMASLTIRKLDEAVKTYLRLRSARNGRSVEEEVRVILGELIQRRPASARSGRAVEEEVGVSRGELIQGRPDAAGDQPPTGSAGAAAPAPQP